MLFDSTIPSVSARIGLPPPPYGSNVNRERRVMWCAQETKELIRLAGRMFGTNANCRKHSKEVYQIISDEMKRRGHHKSLEQCRIKWKHLKGFYFEALLKDTEADQLLICPFFKELEPILKNAKKGAARGSGSSSTCSLLTKPKKKPEQTPANKMPVFQTVLIDEKKTEKPETSDSQKFVIVQDPLGMMKQTVVLKPQVSTTAGTPLNLQQPKYVLSNNQNGVWQQILLTVPQQKGAVQAGQMKPLVVTPQDPLSLPKAPAKNATPPSATATSTPSRAASASPAPAPSVAPLAPIPLTVAPPVVPEICLRWDSYNKNMRNMFPVLLSNERFCDVTLACEGRSIKCHKFMLSACSPYFDQLLGDNPCRHPIVLLKDLQFWEVQAILDFIYKGEVRVRQNKLPQLLAAASCLQIKGLSETVASSPTPNENCDKNTRNDRNDKNDNNSAGLVKPTSHKELKGAQKRKSPPTCSSDSMASTSVDDSDSESEADEQSRLIVVRNSIDEADSTSSGIPTTNGTIIKKIKLEHPSSASCSDSKDQKNCVTEPANPGISVKKKTGNPPNLIKIEHPIITKQEPPEDYENEWKDDGSSSPSYYPDYPEAIVDTVLTEEDASNQ
nr:PREDICTED: uncharacterized protein LOC109034770 isoform X1 [Bemisia tabaci]